MLKFFRKIRKKLIEQENVRKYLLYAVGEILLVVIGILIALQVNNWNNDRKEAAVTQSRLENIRDELTENISLAKEAHAMHVAILDTTTLYLQNKLKATDEERKAKLIFLVMNFEPFKMDLPAIAHEIGIEQTNKNRAALTNQLRSTIVALKKTHDQYTYIQNLTFPRISEVMLDTGVWVSFAETLHAWDEKSYKLSSLYDNEDFKNAVASQYMVLGVYNRDIQRLINEMENTLTYINENY